MEIETGIIMTLVLISLKMYLQSFKTRNIFLITSHLFYILNLEVFVMIGIFKLYRNGFNDNVFR